MTEVGKPKARVRVFYGDNTLAHEFITTGNPWAGYKNKEDRCAFFSFAVDYAGLDEARGHPGTMPRALKPFILLVDEFDFDTRQGRYTSCPYGGRIEIEAI